VTGPTPDLIADLQARGLVHDHTDLAALAKRLEEGPISVYFGCDPTADSLHAGNLIGLLNLRRFQLAGHRPVALAGGATGMIGDPSGRSDERNLLDEDTLATNMASIKEQVARFVDFGPGPNQAVLVDNLSWTGPMTIIDFLRDVGKHATVNQMVAKESVRTRMEGEDGISFTEFTYMLLQANDYWWLHENLAVELQLGGSDQWGNITAGIDMVRRRSSHAVHGLTWPLITRSDGAKFGKSTGDSIWLGAHRTSPYRFFQYWIQVDDRDVGRFLAQLTLLPMDEITELLAEHEKAPERRTAQRRLADEVTTLVHGAEEAATAKAASAVLFGSPLEGVTPATFAALAGEVPTLTLDRSAFAGEGADPVDLLVLSGLSSSKGEARRTISQGGAYANGERLVEGSGVGSGSLLHDRYLLLRRGKRAYALVTTDG
jgi:tyrosyl-tRNA synthetase